MNILENAFVIIHIKGSGFKIGKFGGRSIFTFILLILVLFGAIQVFSSFTNEEGLNVLDIVGSVLYLLFVLFATYSWIRAWSLADRMLSKASDYQKDLEDNKQKEKST